MASFFLAYLWIYCFTKISFYHSVSCALLFFIPPYTVLRSRLQLLRIVSFGYFRARCTKDSFGIILFEKRERYIASDSTCSVALSTHPDKNCFAGAQEAFKLVVEAHSVLSVSAKRTKHDYKRENGSSTTFWTKCPHCECQFQYIVQQDIHCIPYRGSGTHASKTNWSLFGCWDGVVGASVPSYICLFQTSRLQGKQCRTFE